MGLAARSLRRVGVDIRGAMRPGIPISAEVSCCSTDAISNRVLT